MSVQRHGIEHPDYWPVNLHSEVGSEESILDPIEHPGKDTYMLSEKEPLIDAAAIRCRAGGKGLRLARGPLQQMVRWSTMHSSFLKLS